MTNETTATTAPRTCTPVLAQFPGSDFIVGAGVAIFHIATARVVICRAQDRGSTYYFLPKGRRDAGEESGPGAEREGYEEVCEPHHYYHSSPTLRSPTSP
ncbi:hypothetical protein LEMA_P017110.1 [Plenodomus lingam JN3]|uniref:Nudix hydrolase domain-containing protein n=1 Tax=Leptosphaeria maculans (strain JN3 / isolate v23.1.3 / race Av1-4-5-6-7-8) TaxID=985895 RepID=E5AA90_LEPMJ|nr:hypothetical protein LEMA_P017110.1 [Plenodomus lingam JN3]CBY00581.1 hypothetical protein LEMA_P017110.1 [Plenodomus lingam JN3]